MTRLAALTMALTMAVSFTACGSSNSGSTSSSNSSSTSSSTSGSVASQVTIDYSKNLTDDGLWDGINLSDYVTLPEYKGISIPADKATPTEEDIEAQRQQILSNFGTVTQITDRAVEKDDKVNIDYVGSVDGVEFTGGNTNGQGTTVTAGGTNYIDDFLTQIIGHKPGETFNVEVTFPDDYSDSTDADGNTIKLAGKDAVFVTTINYIEGDTTYPEFNDDFVKTNLESVYGWTTADEANQAIKDSLANSDKSTYLQDYLLKNTTIKEIPQVISDTLLEQEEGNLNNVAASYGMSVDYVLSIYGFDSMDAFRDSFAENAGDQIKLQMIYEAIAQKENLIPTSDELKTELGSNYDTAIQTYGETYMKRQLMLNKAANFVLDNSTVA